MRAIRRIRLFSLLAVGTLLAQNAGAAYRGGAPHYSRGDTFDSGSTFTIVDYKVYKETSDVFVDSCQISDQDFAAGLNSFSGVTPKGAGLWLPAGESDPVCCYVDPVLGAITGSPVQSMDFLFDDTTDTGKQPAPSWLAGDRKTISGPGHTVRWEYVHSGRFTYGDTGTGGIRFAWHNQGTVF